MPAESSGSLIPRPGAVSQYVNMIPNTIIAALDNLIAANDLQVTLTYWTKPANADPSKKCSMTYVLRTDGLSEREIELIKSGTDQGDSSRFVFDPVAWNMSFPEDQRYQPPKRQPMPTKIGWERMTVGESRIVRLIHRDVRQLLAAAMLQRNLAWTFEIRRMRHLETCESKIPVWQITRIT